MVPGTRVRYIYFAETYTDLWGWVRAQHILPVEVYYTASMFILAESTSRFNRAFKIIENHVFPIGCYPIKRKTSKRKNGVNARGRREER